MRGSLIWCPFDTKESFYVKVLRENGCEVIYSHIYDEDFRNQADFFEAINDLSFHPDYISSNPPYSKKTEVLETLFKSPYKFAMLLGWLGFSKAQKALKCLERMILKLCT